MEDPGAVVAEMARVLTPGGRLVIFEPDADSVMTDNGGVTPELQRQFVGGLQNPDISRRLQRLVLDNGLDLLEASRVTLGEFSPFDYLDDVARVCNVAAEVADQWRAEIKADSSDRPSAPAVIFRVLATKPSLDGTAQ
jgi:SAM-dependent methyltransferase